jgi:hypothetical protein
VVGTVTRADTNTNRLRRVDRWIAALPELRRTGDPLVVDLGYGASGVTAFELQHRLAKVRPDVEVRGLEIDPGRVATALAQLEAVRAGSTGFDPRARVGFAVGGFEVPLPAGRHAAVIRAFNVLRQYDESEVAAAWERMLGRLQLGGALVEGTCDEIGRSRAGSRSTGRAADLHRLAAAARARRAERRGRAAAQGAHPPERPRRARARLPRGLDRLWRKSTRRSPRTAEAALDGGGAGDARRRLAGCRRPTRWRLGELTVAWEAVAPA